jgi:hypothetical protein
VLALLGAGVAAPLLGAGVAAPMLGAAVAAGVAAPLLGAGLLACPQAAATNSATSTMAKRFFALTNSTLILPDFSLCRRGGARLGRPPPADVAFSDAGSFW